jgi:hypothetical protein
MGLKESTEQADGSRNRAEPIGVRQRAEADNRLTLCPCCWRPMQSARVGEWIWAHNVRTCALVNLALAEMQMSFTQQIRVEVYPNLGPLKGFYTLTEPYTIHISEDAYLAFPEYTIFHEMRHLVDCHTRGWSEEASPDLWARSLCQRYGYTYPPPSQYMDNWYRPHETQASLRREKS